MQNTGPYTLALGTQVQLIPPSSVNSFAKVILSNLSPFVVQVNIGGYQPWLMPFTADLYEIGVGDTPQVQPVLELQGASADSSLLATWLYGDETVADTYPTSLVSQAILAAISGLVPVINGPGTTLGVGTTQFLAATAAGVTAHTFKLNSFAYPAGLSAGNFHSAYVAINGVAGDEGTVQLVDSNGNNVWDQPWSMNAGTTLATVAIPLEFGALNATAAIVVDAGIGSVAVDIILDQEPNAIAALLTGVTPGTTLPIAATNTAAVDTVEALICTENGVLYSAPTPPSDFSGDHPPNELKAAGEDNQTTALTVVAAPGAGNRLRIFYAELAITAGTGTVVLGTGAGNLRCAAGFAEMRQLIIPLSGVPIAANTAITTGVSGTVTYGCNVIYTVEAV